jgi:membrane protease YdiL (CAAX protease family)
MIRTKGKSVAPNKLGETRGPFVVWIFLILYFTIPQILFTRSSGNTLPQDLTVSLVLALLSSMLIGWGPIIVFFVTFLALWEKRRSLTDIFSSVGLKRKGSGKSLLWGVALFPLITIIVSLLMLILSYFIGPSPLLQGSGPSTGQAPAWYPYYMIMYSFFPVAVVEEAIGRGYVLDRLMPQHPSSLTEALPAIILSSLLFTLYHLPSYLMLYSFSVAWTFALLAGSVFPFSVALSITYVQAKSRNVLGAVLIHFLADSLPSILMLLG